MELSKIDFKIGYELVCDNFEKEPKDKKMKVVYSYLVKRNKITLEQFKIAVAKLMEMDENIFFQNYHGGMPAVGGWLKLCELQKPTAENKLAIDKKAFLEKVSDVLSCEFPSEKYLPRFEREYFDKQLTDTEHRAMRAVGDISTLWGQVHNGEYSSSSRTILKELGKAFEDIWMEEHTPLLANYAEEQRQQLNKPTLQLEAK